MKIKFDTIQDILGLEFYDSYIEKYINLNLSKEVLELDTYLTSEKHGIEYIINHDNDLTTIIFYNEEEEYEKFNQPLPYGLSFDMSRDFIRTKYGNPTKINEEGIPSLGVYPSDIYIKEKYRVCISYQVNFKYIMQVQVTIEKFNS